MPAHAVAHQIEAELGVHPERIFIVAADAADVRLTKSLNLHRVILNRRALSVPWACAARRAVGRSHRPPREPLRGWSAARQAEPNRGEAETGPRPKSWAQNHPPTSTKAA